MFNHPDRTPPSLRVRRSARLADAAEAESLGDEVATALTEAYGGVGVVTEGGKNRLAWTIEYRARPGIGDRQGIEAVRDADDGYDWDRWPPWRDWVADANARASRRIAVERLSLLGVLGEDDRR